VFNDTGGLSAGNTLEEAILQGIAEVIERDALYYAFNLGNLSSMPMVTFENTKNRHIQKYIAEVLPQEGIFAFYIQNKGLELNIASFGAFVCYEIGNERHYFGGSGTSLNPETALLRALTELEQQKIRQKVFVEFDSKDLVSHHGLRREDATDLSEIPNQSTDDIRKDIELYLDRLSENDTDVIIINLTHPEIGIPVVRVVVPKLISYSGSPIRETVFLNVIRSHAPVR
jgi:ribosomal protein S12 methylthiotransferase accessory factor